MNLKLEKGLHVSNMSNEKCNPVAKNINSINKIFLKLIYFIVFIVFSLI